MDKKNIRKRAQQGINSYGLNIALHDPSVVEMAARAGYDFVRVDCEHMMFGMDSLMEMIRTARLLGMPIQARITSIQQDSALLDFGVSALMLPHVSTPEKARAIVKAVKYAPLGERGMTTASRALNFGEYKMGEYCKTANDDVSVIIQIEDREGLENIDEILSVSGVDMVATGRNDLSQALNVPGQNTHPDVLAAEEMVIRKAIEHGKVPTLLVKNLARIQQLQGMGVHCFTIARDDGLLYSSLQKTLKEMKEE